MKGHYDGSKLQSRVEGVYRLLPSSFAFVQIPDMIFKTPQPAISFRLLKHFPLVNKNL